MDSDLPVPARVAVGAAGGFAVGLLAGIPLSVLVFLAAPIGAAIGACMGALLPARALAAFVVGFGTAGVAAAAASSFALRAAAGTSGEDAFHYPSGYGLTVWLLAVGAALLGGSLAALVASLWQPHRSFLTLALADALMVLVIVVSAGYLFVGNMSYEAWSKTEKDYLAMRRAADDEARASRQAAERSDGLPVHSGPFLYPGPSSISGDFHRLLLETPDSPGAVAQYYSSRLGAALNIYGDAAAGGGTWDGEFYYEGKHIHVRIAPARNASAAGGADVSLSVPPARGGSRP